jgi:hypothetical protein
MKIKKNISRERIINCGEFNNSLVLINSKIDLFGTRELENCQKCSGFENFWSIKNSDVYANLKNSEYVNIV